jgi:FkbM family methyltransferase
MTVRSYAQNFEDVLLWRALKDVPAGTYVDVGAGHPSHNSVTKLFYEAGWSGINVEPVAVLADELGRDRERDVNVRAAVSSQDIETVDLTVVVDWDELSTISTDRADELRSQGRAVETQQVPAVRLDALLERHGVSDVHFLKVDVEGAELDVLNSIDLTRTRPWIVVVEVVAGGTQSSTRSAIRSHLSENRYTHSYFDGLNDFYVAEEHAGSLLPSFATPVNVTDDFVSVSDSDHVMVDLIGTKLGMEAPAQASEVLQRVEAVLRDRIEFERRVTALAATVAEHKATIDKLVADGVDWQPKMAALEQTAFERERLIAWYATEVSNYRGRYEDHSSVFARVDAARIDAEKQLSEVLSSTSWRTTVPIRAARRPAAYLRRWVQR